MKVYIVCKRDSTSGNGTWSHYVFAQRALAIHIAKLVLDDKDDDWKEARLQGNEVYCLIKRPKGFETHNRLHGSVCVEEHNLIDLREEPKAVK